MKHFLDKRINTLNTIMSPNRIKVLLTLFKDDTCVCQMVNNLSLKHNLLSHHLQVLMDLGFVYNKRNGKHIIYSLNKNKKDCVKRIIELLKYRECK